MAQVYNNNQITELGNLEYEKLESGDYKICGAKINNNKTGLWMKYNNKFLIYITVFMNDKIEGPLITPGEKDIIQSGHDCFSNGLHEGLSIGYNYDGTFSTVGKFKSGKRDSIWDFYTKKGILNQKIDFSGIQPKLILDNGLDSLPPPPVPKPSDKY